LTQSHSHDIIISQTRKGVQNNEVLHGNLSQRSLRNRSRHGNQVCFQGKKSVGRLRHGTTYALGEAHSSYDFGQGNHCTGILRIQAGQRVQKSRRTLKGESNYERALYYGL